jgi:hypothetical protein
VEIGDRRSSALDESYRSYRAFVTRTYDNIPPAPMILGSRFIAASTTAREVLASARCSPAVNTSAAKPNALEPLPVHSLPSKEDKEGTNV